MFWTVLVPFWTLWTPCWRFWLHFDALTPTCAQRPPHFCFILFLASWLLLSRIYDVLFRFFLILDSSKVDLGRFMYRFGHRFTTKLVAPLPSFFFYFKKQKAIPHTHTHKKLAWHSRPSLRGTGVPNPNPNTCKFTSQAPPHIPPAPPPKTGPDDPLAPKLQIFQNVYRFLLPPKLINISYLF